MDTFLWVLQILFGLFFIGHGAAMVIKPAQLNAQLEELPFSSSFLSFIGVMEVLGGIGLILPMWTNILPWLTPLAAVGLAIIMAGAVWSHLTRRETPQIVVTLVITLVLAFVFISRLPLFDTIA